MNALVIDTSSWISYFNEKNSSLESEIDLALKEGRVHMSPLVASELCSGVKQSDSYEKQLKEFLLELPICDNSLEHWFRVAKLRKDLAKKGLSISTPDAHVLQCALDLDCYFIYEDKIFDKASKFIRFKKLNV